jgi:hypothetical protein
MKIQVASLLVTVALLTLSAPLYADSIRLNNGRLIQEGMSVLELLELAGEPEYRDIHSSGISLDRFSSGKQIETWSYIHRGMYVFITIENGRVVEINKERRY